MQGPDYLFAFMDKDFNFWSYDNLTGEVKISALPYFMEFSPEGWDEIAIQNIRNKTYKSVDRSVTIPLGYVRDGATILKHICYTKGFKEIVYLVTAAQELDYKPGVSYKYWYKQVYRGEVDWGTFDHTGLKVTCATLEDGLPKFLKASDKTMFEYPMNVPEAIKYKNDGVVLQQKASFLVTNGANLSNTGNHSVSLVLLNIEGINVNIKHVLRTRLEGSSGLAQNTFAYQNTLWFLSSEDGSPVFVNWDFYMRCTFPPSPAPNPAVILSLTIRNIASDGTIISSVILQQYSTPANVYNKDNHFKGSNSITPRAGTSIYLIMALTTIGSTGDGATTFTYGEEGTFNITKTTFRKRPTYCLGLRLQYVFDKLIRSVTGDAYKAASSLFLERHANKILTSGEAIRGIEEAKIKISLDMLFQYLDSVWSVGLIDRKTEVDIDEEETIIDLTSVISLPSPTVGTFRVIAAKDLFMNELEIGFPEIKNDVGVLNGKEEFNCKFIYSTDATTLTGKMIKVSPIKTSCYEMEGIRILLYGTQTTDNKNDNEVYAVHIEDNTQPALNGFPLHYRINRDLNGLVTAGLLEPASVYNLFYTPKRSFYRQGANIHGRFYLGENTLFKFRSADQNKELICEEIEEKKDVVLSELTTPKLVPFYLEMNIPIGYNILSLLNLNPLQVFEVPINGQMFIGALENIGINPSKNSAQKIILRGSYSNNYVKLIKYNG